MKVEGGMVGIASIRATFGCTDTEPLHMGAEAVEQTKRSPGR